MRTWKARVYTVLTLSAAWAFATLADVAIAEDVADLQLNWRYEVVKSASKDEIEVVFTTDIPAGWILYATDFVAELGPRPAKFTFEKDATIDLVDSVRSINASRRKDKNFDTEYAYFSQRAEFRQRVRLQNNTSGTIAGSIQGQACYEKDGLCTLYKQSFQVKLR